MPSLIISLCGLGILLGVSTWTTCRDNERLQRRIAELERRVNELSGRVNTVARESKISHERLVNDLWRRASAEVDREIEKARKRGRGF
jgi:cell division septum initiation protein DivIVA